MAGNVDKLRAGHARFNERDFAGSAGAILSDTSEFIDHGRGETTKGRDEFAAWLQSHTAMASDMKIVDATYIDAGDHVTAQFRAVGTQDGPLGPFPPSNKPFSLDIAEVWHFGSDGLATQGHNYSDGLGLLIQLGHVEAPG